MESVVLSSTKIIDAKVVRSLSSGFFILETILLFKIVFLKYI